MKKLRGTCKTSKFAKEDFISSMPDIVITNILDRLPIKEAVRTDILSRKWRFKWTLLTQLVFDKTLFLYSRRPFERQINADKIISRLLFNLKGPLTKFVLFIPHNNILNFEDVNHWVIFLSSTKGIKDLTIKNVSRTQLKLSTQLFSIMELKRLKLHGCHLHPPTSFHGFPYLSSLDLSYVTFQSYTFITGCPLLEILKICNLGTTAEEILLDISKHENLRMIYLSWYNSANVMMIKSSSIFQLMSLPKLQELELDFGGCKLLAEDGVQDKVPAAFLCLKSLTLYQVDFSNDTIMSFVYELIRCSPNLHKLMIEAKDGNNALHSAAVCSPDLDIYTMGQLQLRRVLFPAGRGLENEVRFIKTLLASSPFLEKMDVHPSWSLKTGENLRFAKKLLKLHRASPTAEIDFY